MKIDVAAMNAPAQQLDPQPGYVYPARGGTKPQYWVVMNIDGNRAILLGLDYEGNIVSGASYSAASFKNRPVIGYVDLSNMKLDMRPFP